MSPKYSRYIGIASYFVSYVIVKSPSKLYIERGVISSALYIALHGVCVHQLQSGGDISFPQAGSQYDASACVALRCGR